MPESNDRRLQKPDYLGAPAPSPLTPRASRLMERGRSFGRESSRMILLSLLGGVGVIFGLLVLGHVVRG